MKFYIENNDDNIITVKLIKDIIDRIYSVHRDTKNENFISAICRRRTDKILKWYKEK